MQTVTVGELQNILAMFPPDMPILAQERGGAISVRPIQRVQKSQGWGDEFLLIEYGPRCISEEKP